MQIEPTYLTTLSGKFQLRVLAMKNDEQKFCRAI